MYWAATLNGPVRLQPQVIVQRLDAKLWTHVDCMKIYHIRYIYSVKCILSFKSCSDSKRKMTCIEFAGFWGGQWWQPSLRSGLYCKPGGIKSGILGSWSPWISLQISAKTWCSPLVEMISLRSVSLSTAMKWGFMGVQLDAAPVPSNLEILLCCFLPFL